MCSSHQPGSVTRYHMAIVAIMVLLLFLTAAITGTCSLSTEGNMLRHTAPVPSRTVSSAAMPGCLPGCPMHHVPCSPATGHQHGLPSACALCTAPDPAAVTALSAPDGVSTFAVVRLPGLPSLIPQAPAPASPVPPPPDPPLLARPSSLRV